MTCFLVGLACFLVGGLFGLFIGILLALASEGDEARERALEGTEAEPLEGKATDSLWRERGDGH